MVVPDLKAKEAASVGDVTKLKTEREVTSPPLPPPSITCCAYCVPHFPYCMRYMYWDSVCHATCGTGAVLAVRSPVLGHGVCCAVCGTEVAYGAVRCAVLRGAERY
eukprot:2638410-Rhodomonas_salina.2